MFGQQVLPHDFIFLSEYSNASLESIPMPGGGTTTVVLFKTYKEADDFAVNVANSYGITNNLGGVKKVDSYQYAPDHAVFLTEEQYQMLVAIIASTNGINIPAQSNVTVASPAPIQQPAATPTLVTVPNSNSNTPITNNNANTTTTTPANTPIQPINKRVDPDHTDQSQLKELNELLAYINKSHAFHYLVQQDAIKVINCLRFLKCNIPLLVYGALHPKDPSIYMQSGDNVKHVIRDFNGTAIHILDRQGLSHLSDQQFISKVADDYKKVIAQFEHCIRFCQSQLLLDRFINALRYDGDVGCIEQRIAAALDFAQRLESSPRPNFNDIMNEAYKSLKDPANLSDEDFYIGIYKHLVENFHIGRSCIHVNKDHVITQALIDKFIEDDFMIIKPKTGISLPCVVRKGTEALALMKKEEALIKVISEASIESVKNLEFLVNQLVNPEVDRPVKPLYPTNLDRKKVWNPRKYKLENRVVQSDRGLPKITKWTKKTATSLLPATGRMKMFYKGSHVIGLLFHLNECDVNEKFIFLENAGTDEKWWVGRQGYYRPRACTIADIRAKNRRVGTYMPTHNEILAKLTKKSVYGVFATEESHDAFVKAVIHKHHIKKRLNIDVPVLVVQEHKDAYELSTKRQIEELSKVPSHAWHYPQVKEILDKHKQIGEAERKIFDQTYDRIKNNKDLSQIKHHDLKCRDKNGLNVVSYTVQHKELDKLKTILSLSSFKGDLLVDEEDQTTVLLLAAKLGDLELLQLLLDSKHCSAEIISKQDRVGKTVLHHALVYGHDEMVKKIILAAKFDLGLLQIKDNVGRTAIDLLGEEVVKTYLIEEMKKDLVEFNDAKKQGAFYQVYTTIRNINHQSLSLEHAVLLYQVMHATKCLAQKPDGALLTEYNSLMKKVSNVKNKSWANALLGAMMSVVMTVSLATSLAVGLSAVGVTLPILATFGLVVEKSLLIAAPSLLLAAPCSYAALRFAGQFTSSNMAAYSNLNQLHVVGKRI